MPSPSIVFSFIVATLYGSTFHLIVGGDARRLALFLLASWVGFPLGQIIGEVMNLNLATIGAVHLFTASLGTLVALMLTWFFSRPLEEET